MTKGNRVYRGQSRLRPCYPPRLTESKASSSALPGTPLASGKLQEDRRGAEKQRQARPQSDGLLTQAEEENAVSRCFSPHPACCLLSTDGILFVAYNRFDALKEELALLHGQGIGSVAAAETLRDLFHPVV